MVRVTEPLLELLLQRIDLGAACAARVGIQLAQLLQMLGQFALLAEVTHPLFVELGERGGGRNGGERAGNRLRQFIHTEASSGRMGRAAMAMPGTKK